MARSLAREARGFRLAAALKAGLVALVVGLVAAAPAAAVAPFALTDQVTDRAGAVEGHIEEIRVAFEELEAEHGVRMWVVFVDSFEGDRPQQWAEATFRATRLGEDDYLLAVAVSDRQYGYIVDDAFVLGDAALDRVASAARPYLAENPSRAAIEAAEAIGAQIDAPPSKDEDGSGPEAILIPLIAVGAVALVVAKGIWRVRRGLPFFEPSSGGSGGMASDHDAWPNHGGSSSGGGGGGTRGGGGSF